MARTIAEIKQEMTDRWMADEAVRERYDIAEGESFETRFSKVSIESLLFYTVAFGVWVLEKLIDRHRADVEAMLEAKRPHTTRWYREQILAFVPSWAEEPPVKYCAVDDGADAAPDGNKLTVKIAKGQPGSRQRVSTDEAEALGSWLAQNKDAGVKITVVNKKASRLVLRLTVWYDPLSLRPADKTVEKTVKEYVSNLDFDGLLSRNNIESQVRAVEGVKLVRIDDMQSADYQESSHPFRQQERSAAGYWAFEQESDLAVMYEPYSRGMIGE